jgi:putative oxidoreductase
MDMRNVALLGGRLALGGYLAAHGAQKMFGSFGGHGLEATGKGFESMGLSPGKEMATLAAASELGGGVLTMLGAANPIGPFAVLGAMTVATAVHRKAGPFAMAGGYELPLTNAALAALLMGTGPGAIRLPVNLPRSLTRLALLGGAGLTGYSLAKLLRFEPPAADPDPAETETGGTAV